MKRVVSISVISTAILSACASEPKVDYSKWDAECVRICQKSDTECKARFAELPTVLYTHCKPELKACVNACPPQGTTPPPSPVIINAPTNKQSISDRLKVLEELYKSGAITDKEHADKRQEILNSL